MRYALMLTLILLIFSVVIGTTRAQPTSTTDSTELASVRTMSLAEFRERRKDKLATVNEIRSGLGLSLRKFAHDSKDIEPSKRLANLAYWRGVVKKTQDRKDRFWRAKDKSLHSALHYASNVFNYSFSILHNCVHSEGGHGMIPNNQGSGAFGPFQFMQSTFEGYSKSAWHNLHHRGVMVPWSYRDWNGYLGQSLAAAWAFSHGRSYAWSGGGCVT